MPNFENKVTEAEEKTKREKVLEELKNLYLNKIKENHLNLNEIFSKNLNDKNAEIEFSSEVDDKIISDLIKSTGFTATTIENA